MKTSKAILLVLILTISVVGITYAYYTWSGKAVVSGLSECFNVNYLKGRDITSNSLKLGTSPLDGISTTIEASLSSSCTITLGSGTLYLDIDTSTTDALLASNALKYQLIVGNTFAKEGILTTKGRNTLLEDIEVTEVSTPIIVIIWIDSSLVDSTNSTQIMSSTFSAKINMEIESRRQ